MAHLVSRKLPQACQHHLHHARIGRLPLLVRREQRLEDEVILPRAQRAECHVALDDLAGARIDDGRAIRPAARGAMHPLNVVVAHVERIGVGGQHLHLKRIAEARGLEGLVPPACALQQGRANRLRRGRVEVVHDGRHRIADSGARIFLFQAMADDESLLKRLADGLAVVGVGGVDEARARVERSRLDSCCREAE